MIPNIKMLRQRLGLEEDDQSRDESIQAMSPRERVRMLSGWELGDPTWADVFESWFREQGLVLVPKESTHD